MERTFSMEYSALKGERAQQRQNKKKHGVAANCGWSSNYRRGRRDRFSAEHGSSASQKAHDPEAFLKQQAERSAVEEDPCQVDVETFQQVAVGIRRTYLRKKAIERKQEQRKTNKAGRPVLTEQDELDRFSRPKHIMVPAIFFGARPQRRVPQPRRRALATEGAPAPRQRRPGADALIQRLLVMSQPGSLPGGEEEAVRLAAARLRAIRPSNRPATGPKLEGWLRQRGGCRGVRVDMLMTPGALAEALLPLLEDFPSARRAVAPFANAGRGVDPKDPGPSPEDTAAAARRARLQLRHVGEEVFSSWPWPQCARWLCSQSYVLLHVEASAVLAALRRMGAVLDSATEGRIAYGEKELAAVAAPRRGEWCVLALEKVARTACCQQAKIHLGWGLACRERVECLRLAELGKLKEQWSTEAKKKLGEAAPGIMSVKAKFNKTSSVLVVHTCVLGSEGTVPAADACQALVRAVKADIAEHHSPRAFRMENLAFRCQLPTLHVLEHWLGCMLDLVRDDEGYLIGSVDVTLSRHSKASEAQVREILGVTFSPEPAFRHPGLLDAEEATWLAEEPGLQQYFLRYLLTTASAIVEAWQPDEATPTGDADRGQSCLDICGWPCPSLWQTYEGDYEGAASWFRLELVPDVKERMLKASEERQTLFPEARERAKFLKEEEQREKRLEEELQEAARSGRKIVLAGGRADEGPSKRW